MKSPVVILRDPAAATKQRAKLSQEGSYIPIFINISIIKKLSAVRTYNKSGEKRTEKNLARIDGGF
jgi:hypothetical protein